MASWQNCIDCNTTSARLSKFWCNTCSPGVWRTDSSLSKQGKKGAAGAQSLQHIVSRLPAEFRPPSSVHLLAKEKRALETLLHLSGLCCHVRPRLCSSYWPPHAAQHQLHCFFREEIHFHPQTFHSNDTFIHFLNVFIQSPISKKQFHPKTVSSNDTFVQIQFHPMTHSSPI